MTGIMNELSFLHGGLEQIQEQIHFQIEGAIQPRIQRDRVTKSFVRTRSVLRPSTEDGRSFRPRPIAPCIGRL